MQEVDFFNHVSAWSNDREMENDREYELYHNSSVRRKTPEFHSHDFYEIYFFITGDASLYIEEYAFRMQPRDVFIIPPGRMHRAFFHDLEAYYERMFLYVSRSALQRMGTPDCPLSDILDGCVERGHFRFTLDEEHFAACLHTFSEVIADSVNDAPHQQLINRCKVTMLLARLCGRFGEEKAEHKLPASTRVAAVITYINEHIAEHLTLDAISGRFFVSKYYLIREFKNYTNKSVYQYILSKRIILAKALLQSGGSPTDVYLRCGFLDYSSFYKAFRKETGLSPQQYVRGLARAAQG